MRIGRPGNQSIVEKHVDMLLRFYEERVALIEPHRVMQSMRPSASGWCLRGRRDRTC